MIDENLTSLTKILNSQPMINLSQGSPVLNVSPPSKGYRCGCGDHFSRCVEFKEHSILFHDGRYIENSSHFLALLTNIVLPVQQPSKNQGNTRDHEKRREFLENQSCEIETVSKIQSLVVHNTTKRQKVQVNSISSLKTKKFKSAIMPQPIIEDAAESDQIIEWNGFQLIKNKKCPIKPFFCGKCKITFALAEELIIHCIEICKRLKHRDSSHLILCTFQQQKQSEDEEELQENDEQQASMQKKSENNKRLCLFDNKSDHRHLPLYCGYCQKYFDTITKYYMDIKNNHSQIVHPLSSHIIIRRNLHREKNGLQRIHYTYISDTVEWPRPFEYYCPCKPDVNMDMAKLIKHVRQVHRGISPIYRKSDDNSGASHSDSQEQKQDMSSIRKIVYFNQEIFRKILANYRNYKIPFCKPPFICYTCEKQYSMQKIACHLKWHKAKKVRNNCSHVIIVLGQFRNIRHLFISVTQQWDIKEPIYHCPCNVEKKITMKELTKHIADKHNFVTPLWDEINQA